MKRLTAVILALLMLLSVSACGSGTDTPDESPEVSTKSEAAQKADDLILAIGEVTVESESAILAAQECYDALTDSEKAEVENHDTLLKAIDLLAQAKTDAARSDAGLLMEQGDYLKASEILAAHPEIKDYAELMKQCGANAVQQCIRENGEEREPGKFFLNLVFEDGNQQSIWYFEETNALQHLYYTVDSGFAEFIVFDYIFGEASMTYSRTTTVSGFPVNTQKGTISVSEYTGGFTGSVVENDPEPLVIPGLTVTEFYSSLGTQPRGYHIATMTAVNSVLDTIFSAVADAGFCGTWSDLGFISYKLDAPDADASAPAAG